MEDLFFDRDPKLKRSRVTINLTDQQQARAKLKQLSEVPCRREKGKVKERSTTRSRLEESSATSSLGYQCLHCSEEFMLPGELQLHYQNQHTTNTVVKQEPEEFFSFSSVREAAVASSTNVYKATVSSGSSLESIRLQKKRRSEWITADNLKVTSENNAKKAKLETEKERKRTTCSSKTYKPPGSSQTTKSPGSSKTSISPSSSKTTESPGFSNATKPPDIDKSAEMVIFNLRCIFSFNKTLSSLYAGIMQTFCLFPLQPFKDQASIYRRLAKKGTAHS